MVQIVQAYPCQVCAISASMQSWHQDVIVWCRNVGWICYEAAGWNVTHALEETAVVYLQIAENTSS